MEALVILAHPNIGGSRFNRRWGDELLKHPDEFLVHELYRTYPTWSIDREREQRLLEEHDLVVLQYPVYWYRVTRRFSRRGSTMCLRTAGRTGRRAGVSATSVSCPP